MTEQETYTRFIDWMRSTWVDLPDSEHLLPMIQANYTPEEAAFLTGLPFNAKSLEELASEKGMEPAQLAPKLKEYAGKGMIFESVRGDSVRYRLSDAMFALMRANLWPGKDDERTKKAAPHINKYFLDGWADQWKEAHTKGLRAVPIDETIEDTRQILPYDDIIQIVDDYDYYSVSACPCRHRHQLDPDMRDCDHPMEACLHFDDLGRYIVANGQGREITKEETFEILRKSADSGLVHGVANYQKRPDTICNCCSCCCLMFEPFHKLGHDAMCPSNYKVTVDASTCKGCALCVKRCPVDALQLKVSAEANNKFGKVAVVDSDLCVGCGVCVHKCPADSIVLVQNEQVVEPPKTARDYVTRFMEHRQAARVEAEQT